MIREPAFLRKNKDTWLEYERTLFSGEAHDTDPDRLADLYVRLTDDLAYARTFYPRSNTHRYLNGLAARTHLLLYRGRREKNNRFVAFWTSELPQIYQRAHRAMRYALFVFLAAMLLGYVSTLSDEAFVRSIFGDAYVNMTIDNIRAGKPTDVYAQASSADMFVQIAFNNISVAFRAFVAGIFVSIGSYLLLLYNGAMVGAFFGFFQTYNVLDNAFPIVMIHGTLELSAIVVAGGAGIMLGNSILFPGTYTRRLAVQRAAKDGVKMVIGLVPVFLLAAFLESYVTRLAQMPLLLKLAIIAVSALFVLWYYVLLPIATAREAHYAQQTKNLHLRSATALTPNLP